MTKCGHFPELSHKELLYQATKLALAEWKSRSWTTRETCCRPARSGKSFTGAGTS